MESSSPSTNSQIWTNSQIQNIWNEEAKPPWGRTCDYVMGKENNQTFQGLILALVPRFQLPLWSGGSWRWGDHSGSNGSPSPPCRYFKNVYWNKHGSWKSPPHWFLIWGVRAVLVGKTKWNKSSEDLVTALAGWQHLTGQRQCSPGCGMCFTPLTDIFYL